MSVTAVLFDLGNVLSHDGHETYLTHEVYGLARNLGLSKEEVVTRVNHIFREFAVEENASERDFWDKIGRELKIELSDDAIELVKRQIDITNPEAVASFELLKKQGIKIGIISNSNPLFYKMQTIPLMLDSYVDPKLIFLSHKSGMLKSNGLFELATSAVVPCSTFVIDDRVKNVEYAQKLGFNAIQYSLDSGESLFLNVKTIVSKNSD